MTSAETVLHDLFGAVEGRDITILQMAARAVVVYIVVIIIVRFGKKRFLGLGSAFDIVVAVLLGAVAGRAISGSAPVLPSLAACAAIVALHWMFSRLAVHSHGWGGIFKGHATLLVHDGQVDTKALRQSHLSRHDLDEELRLHNVATLDQVDEARLERSGQVSILTKDS